MPFVLYIESRMLGGVLAALACAVVSLSDASMATASIMLPDYGAFAYEDERVDLTSSDSEASLSPSGIQTAPEVSEASESSVTFDLRLVFIDASHSGTTGTSAPSTSSSSGSQAFYRAVDSSATDLRVIGWLREARHVGLPEAIPRGLLRPPQA